METNLYKKFNDAIKLYIPSDCIFTDKLTTLAYGTDASCYRLIPQIVIKAKNEEHVRVILKYADLYSLPITFRASGTSLAGQAVSDSILVVLQEGWTSYKIGLDAKYIDLDIGIIAGRANSYLAKFNKKIGPDPATVAIARIGGIVSNNSSGMCCGITENSYQTIKDIRVILQDGTILDTKDPVSVSTFKATHQKLLDELEDLAKEVKRDSALSNLIIEKYKIKNTTGYSLNALVDFSEGIEIIKHLMVGAEGTLGFISKVSLHTVEDLPCKASALVLFEDIRSACAAVIKLRDLGDIVNSAEFMDRKSLRTMENDEGIPKYIKSLGEDACAVLLQSTAYTTDSLRDNIKQISSTLEDFSLIYSPEFTDKEEEYSKYWKIRKGLLTKVGAARRAGTTLIIEDINFPMDDLADGTIKLRSLLDKYNYSDAIIFGHSLVSNLHFVLCIDFSSDKETANYDAFMNALVNLMVVEYRGSLKAEHGTGRNIAPFVEKEWGSKAYSLMLRIKEIFDPKNLINPNVIITKDPQLHLKNLKEMNPCNSIIDSCIECGFCEPVCPSKDITLTPRQRISVYRALKNNKDEKLMHELLSLKDTYHYNNLNTCAACGLCSTVCPVGINVGTLTKDLRAENQSFLVKQAAILFAKTYFMAAFNLRFMLIMSAFAKKIIGDSLLIKLSKMANKLSFGLSPVWRITMPKAANVGVIKNLQSLPFSSDEKTFVYFISCMNKMFGTQDNHPLLQKKHPKTIYEVMMELAAKSGYRGIILSDNSLCCGKTFSSKGLNDAASINNIELKEKLLNYSQNGKYPVVTDLSSCALEMIETFKDSPIKVYDVGEFALKFFANNLAITKMQEPVALHVTCATTKLNDHGSLAKLAKLCAEEVIIPSGVSCCGFAGDKGMFFPELNSSALSSLAEEVKSCKMGFSTNCSCEIGLSEHAKIPYTSVLYLLNEVSRPL